MLSPPIIEANFTPFSKSICVSIALVVVFPCVPAIPTTFPNSDATSPKNSCLSKTGIPLSFALAISGLSLGIADENTKKSALSIASKFGLSPIIAPLSTSFAHSPLTFASLPLTSIPKSVANRARAFTPTPPIPTK